MTEQTNGRTIATPTKALTASDAGKGVTRTRNIKFIGRPAYDAGKRKILDDPSPIERFYHDGRNIVLPPVDWQKKNRLFYHESASEIVTLFPHLYKLIRSK